MSEIETCLLLDALTGKETVRELTADELADVESLRDEYAAEQAQNQQRIDDRASALAKLAALGLTEQEVAAL